MHAIDSRDDARPSRHDARPPLLPPGGGVWRGAPMATRREFAAAAAAAAAAAFAGKADEAFADDAAADGDVASEADCAAAPLETVDADGNVHIINSYRDIIDEVAYEPIATASLPLGSVVYVDCEIRAAVVQANAGSTPFTVVGCLDYATTQYSVVLAEPVTGPAYAPSEARCTERLMAWVEIDNATDAWVLYAVPFTGAPVTSSSPGLVKLGEGDADWLPPQFAVSGSRVVWQVMPDPSGPYVTSYSHAYLWTLGSSSGIEVYESPGRFACGPNISAGVLTIAPRVNPDEGVYYGITALDLDRQMGQVDQLVLPVAVKPFFATRIGDAFAFSVEADYGYGGLLGSMGYYIGPGSGPFDYVAREPSAQITYVGGKYIVKSQLMYFVIDTAAKTYARIGSASGCVDCGDYPATAGTASQFVTYAAVKDSSTGIPNSVLVRIFSLI